MDTTIISKLEKLLALAAGNANVNEANAAMQKAQELALRHKIDIATIGEREEKTSIEKGIVESGQRFSVTQRYVNWILKEFFYVSVVLSGNRTYGRKINIIGKTEDIEFARYVNDFLNEKMMQLWKTYQTRFGINTKEREGYLLGMYRGLQAKLRENKQKLEAENLNAENREKYALVVIDNEKAIEAAKHHFFPELGKAPKKTFNVRSEMSFLQGMKDGRTININKALAA